MNTYQIGDSPRFTIAITDVDGALADPTTMAISIRKPDGSLSVDGIAMTQADTGSYYYDHTVDAQVGIHYIKYIATGAGDRVSIQPDSFKAVESFEA